MINALYGECAVKRLHFCVKSEGVDNCNHHVTLHTYRCSIPFEEISQ